MAKKSSKASKSTKAGTAKNAAEVVNGLKTFSMHVGDESSRPAMAAMIAEEPAEPTVAFLRAVGRPAIDPETAARSYLNHALRSAAVPSFTAPVANEQPSEFKSLGTESVPLTGTTVVKFRQNFSKIPVYGSLVSVELDEENKLVGINSALGTPETVSPIAKLSPAEATQAVKAYPGYTKDIEKVVPHLNYYFDAPESKWRLAYIFQDVPVVPKPRRPSPVLMDFVVDAHSGKVVAALPRSPTVATRANAPDGLGKMRAFEVDRAGQSSTLKDLTLNVQTFDFKFSDPVAQAGSLPGKAIKNPPVFSPTAVSAHANAAEVAAFLRAVVKRNNIDNRGGVMRSSINCVDASDSPDGKEWINAFWNGTQMVYGQRHDGRQMLSMAVALDVVAHEMFHGVTDKTSRLNYVAQSGALNESYSDIFGIIIANRPNTDPRSRTWSWQLGARLRPGGQPFRDLSDPTLYGQPAHMRDYQTLPDTRAGDFGGVHVNSGIHNKAAYHILMAEDQGQLIFTPDEVAAIFYLALTQRLSATSRFIDSRVGVLDSARTLFRNLAPAALAVRVAAIEKAFSSVGIQ
jgi:Zn-dependent metalloprotease